MRSYLHALAMCQSMFCAIPCPWRLWDEEARDKMLLFLPVIGLELGGLWVLLAYLARLLRIPSPIRALVLCLWLFVGTGFLHLDGFMDVTDAVRSCRELGRRREILKDPHVGSFAVIGAIFLLLGWMAVILSAEGKPCGILWLIPGVSRCGSSLAVTTLPPMETSQYAAQKRSRTRLLPVLILLLTALAAGFLLYGKYGFALVGGAVSYALALCRGYGSLDGMNGDIAGYALCISEFCAAAVWALI